MLGLIYLDRGIISDFQENSALKKSKKIPTATMRKSNQHQAFVKNFTNP